jgi:hypothetical protein
MFSNFHSKLGADNIFKCHLSTEPWIAVTGTRLNRSDFVVELAVVGHVAAPLLWIRVPLTIEVRIVKRMVQQNGSSNHLWSGDQLSKAT